MTQPPRIDGGTTRLFSVQYSASPMGAPLFAVTVGSGLVTVRSVTATSGTLAYEFQSAYTLPTGSGGIYRYEWTANFSSSAVSSGHPDIVRGLIQVVTTRPWTT